MSFWLCGHRLYAIDDCLIEKQNTNYKKGFLLKSKINSFFKFVVT